VNSRVIRVSFGNNNNASATGDSIRLFYTSSCGNSQTLGVKLTNTLIAPPTAPASITITAVNTNVCGNRVYRYAAPALTSATTSTMAATGWVWSFTGTLGANASIDSGDVTSQVIRVVYSNGSGAISGDSVRVLYTSACGNGMNKSVMLNNAPIVPIPTSITITLVKDVCGARTYRYTAPVLPVSTATTAAPTGYLWSMPIGSVGSTGVIDSGSLTSRVIVIKYSNNAGASIGDSIKVRYTVSCGSGYDKAQKLSNLPNLNCVTVKGNLIASNQLAEELKVLAFPNPTTTSFNLNIVAAGKDEIGIKIFDLQGRILKSIRVQPFQTMNIGADLKAGSYVMEVRQGSQFVSTRLLKL
jgi:hypothetical protein